MEDAHSPHDGPIDIHKPFTKSELIQQLAQIDNDITLLLSHTSTAIQSLAQPVAPSTPTDGSPPTAPDNNNNNNNNTNTTTTTTTNNNNNPAPVSALDPEARLATFKASMNAFMATLHSVDVRLKRQIWGLEEAGIITLSRGPGTGGADGAAAAAGPAATAVDGGGGVGGGDEAGGAAGAAAAAETGFRPDGVGKVGGHDVGWINARGSKVERDVEAELWAAMRRHLEAIAAGRLGAAGGVLGVGEPEAEEGDVAMEG